MIVSMDWTKMSTTSFVLFSVVVLLPGTLSQSLPTVTISQTFYSVIIGNDVTLSCSVSGNPSVTGVFWIRTTNDGTVTSLSTANSADYNGGTLNTPSLTILNVDNGDVGQYVCRAVNNIGTTDGSAITLNLANAPPSVTIGQSAYNIAAGNTVTLVCTVNANPAITSVSWTRTVNSQTTSITIDNSKYQGGSTSSPSLVITNTASSDSGSYICSATNSQGTTSSSSTTLTVSGSPPTVSIAQTAFGAQVSTTITLGCTVTSSATVTSVFWQRNVGAGTETIIIDGVNFSGSTPSSPSLTLINADTTDSGTYTCFAVNGFGTGQSATATVTISPVVPTVNIAQTAYTTTEGTTITLQCTVSSPTTVTSVSWQRNVGAGVQSISIDNINYSGGTTSSPSLNVITASVSDSGTYTCTATNNAGTGSDSTTLTVTANIPSVIIQLDSYSTSAGNSLTIPCSVSSATTVTNVFWQRNTGAGTESINVNGIDYSGSTTSNPSLTIIGTAPGDSGTYTCFATNSGGTGSDSTTVTITGNAPSVIIQLDSYSTSAGNSLTIPCSVSSATTVTNVFWQRNTGAGTESINVNGIDYSGSTTSNPSLTIIGTALGDSGTYTCFATNSGGTGSDSTTVTITGNAPSVIIQLDSYSTSAGNSLTIPCSVSSTTTVTNVFWQRNTGAGTESINVNGIDYSGSTTSNPSLTIIGTALGDSGTYTCFASNGFGTASDSATVTITGNAPIVNIQLDSYSATTGTSLTIPCSVSSSSTVTSVSWQRTIGTVTQSLTIDGVNYSGSTPSNPSLTIIGTATSDSGTYTCFATNNVGTGSDSTIVTITGTLPVVTVSQTAYTVTSGTSVTLDCSVSANPTHTNVFWQYTQQNGATTTVTIDNNKYFGGSVGSPSLTIVNTNSGQDQGTYVCFASNTVGTGQSAQVSLTVTGDIPVVTTTFISYTVTTGQAITIDCTVSANPAHTDVTWIREVNNAPVTINIDGVKYSGASLNNPSLTIFNAAASDIGIYACTATNAVGTGTSALVTLAVTGSIPVVTIAQTVYTVNTGQTVTLGCSVSADPTHTTVFWQRTIGQTTSTLNIDGVKYQGSTVNVPSLTIVNVGSSDQATYTCSATNAVGTGTSSSTTLTVLGNLPVVTIAQSAYTVTTGQTITLGCSVAATPAHTNVFWQRIDNGVASTINIDGNKYSGATTGSPSLTITNAAASDQTLYTCSATNAVGTGTSAQTTLTVVGSLPVVTIPQSVYTVTTGQTVTLGCSVSATPGHTSVFWQRIDNGVASTLSINGVKYSGGSVNFPSLVIFNAAASDQATYTCSATNSVGTGTSGQTTLIITGSIPVVTIAQSAYSVTTGQTVTLGCSVSADPFHTNVFWQRIDNGVASTLTIDGTKYSGATVNSPSLIISNAASSDQTTYTCSATNSVGTGTSGQTILTVTGSIPVVTIAQSAYSVTTGQTVTLGCSVSADPFHTNVFWQRIDNGVASTLTIDGTKYSGATVNSPSLVIFNAASSDQTTYTCSATNSVGTGTSGQTTLTVTGSIPVVTIAQSTYSVITGQTVTLGCSVSANPTHTNVFWQRIDNGVASTLTIDGTKYSGATVNSPSLIISNAASNDQTTYTCSATNSVGTGTSGQTILTVTGSVPIVTIAQSTYSVITGQTVTLGCSVSADPFHTTVFWQRIDNGVASTLTIDGTKYSGATVNSPSLVIFNAASSDQTIYTCSATNSVGTGTSGQTTLTVTGSIPIVTIAQSTYSVITGQTVTLGCSVSADPFHTTVFWQRIDNGVTSTLTIDGTKYSGATVNSPSLIISNAASSDQTTYTCSATNSVGTGTSGQTILTVTGSIPIVTIAQSTYSVITGQTVTLGCSVSADPFHTTVFWQRIDNGVASTLTIDGTKYSGATVNSPSLIISNAASSDQTTYTCSATNSVGTGTSGQTILTVTGSIPVVTIAQSTYSVTTGQTVTLGCSVSADPFHTTVFWQRIDNGVASTLTIDGTKYSGATVNSPSLIISNAASSDQTTYTCSATNSVGTGTSGQTTLTVTGSIPVVTVAQPAYSVVTGQTVTLTCTVSANPAHSTVFWQRIDNGVASTITIDGNKYSGATVNSPSLVIFNAAASDQTTYTCSATNIVGTGTSGQTTLTVTGNIPVVTIAQSAYTVITGQTVTLGCTVSADPSHTNVFWQRIDNGVASTLTIDGSKYQGATVNNPSLTITNANSNDITVYTCSATNVVGTGTSGQTTLSVTGNVPAVTIAQPSYSVVTGQTVTLGCSISANPIHTEVFWQRTQNGVTNTITIDNNKYIGSAVNSPSLTITSAAASDQATYTCSATNIVGTGTSSSTTLTVTGSIPVVTIAQPAYSVVTGQTVTLGCSVSADPTHTQVFWQGIVNGVATTLTIDGSKYSGATVNSPSLVIFNAAASDQTTYTCSAVNAVGTGTSSQTTLTVTGSIPVVTIVQPSYSVVTGQTVTLGCTVSADPTHTQVFWQRTQNGATNTITIDGNKYQGSTVNTPSLTITSADASDQATYTCFATNIVGTGTSSTTTLTVTGSIPVVTIAQAAYSVVTGQTVTLGCSVSADPFHTTVFWQRIDNGVASTLTIDGSKYSGATVNSPSLVIFNAAANDQTIYTCSATNIVGTGTSGQTTLTVTGSIPVVQVVQPAYSVVTGQSVTLGCTVSADPTHTQVFWQRTQNGVTNSITIDGNKYQGATVNTPSLTINSAAASDQASYTCSATNIVGTGTSTTTTLTVTGSIPVVTIAQSAYSVVTGQTVTLGCSVSADPFHTAVFWQRIDSGVASTLTIDGTKYSGATVNNPSLTITNANSNDFTVYTCSATNAVGTGTSGQTTLTVTGNIPVVTIAQAAYSVLTGQSVTLDCSVSADPAHSQVFWQITQNGVTSAITIDNNKYQGGTVNSPSLIITNAAASDQATYTCSATNIVGTGTSTTTTLTVTGSIPVVTIAQNAYSVITGQTVTLGCSVTATPTHTQVFWQRIDNGVASTITVNGIKYSGATVNNPSLTITNANSNDITVYTCSATNAVGTGTSGQTTLTVTGNIPAVTISQPSYSVVTGQSVTIDCTVSADPTHTQVFWQITQNGATSTITIDGNKYQGATVNSPSLTISNAAASDQAVYTCSATNIVGTGTSTTATLTVTGSIPVVTIAQNAYSVVTGQTVTLGCSVSADPFHTQVFWQRIDNGVASTLTIDGSKYSGATVNNPSLTITNANSNDITIYTCSATNAVGTGTSGQTTLTVTGNIPVVQVVQPSYSVVTGQSVTLGCTVSADPTHTQVFWQRTQNGVTNSITIDGNKYQGATVNVPSLTINSAAASDQAVYTCSATNIVGTGTSTTTTLTVTGSIPVVTIAQPTYSVTTGQTITLGCSVSADPFHTTVFWQRIDNGVASTLTIDGTKYSGATVNSPSLVIFNAAANDQTTYTCSATNAVGTGTSGQTTLTVTGSIPVVTIVQPAYSVITGQTVTLGCSVSADPTHTTVFWQRTIGQTTSTLNIDGVKFQGSTVNIPSLTITNAAASDQATYTCSASNIVGTGVSSTTTLTVTGSIPVVNILQPTYSVITGTTVTLECAVSADPSHTSVFWQRIVNGVTSNIVIDGSNYAGSTVNSPSLVVFNANSADQGAYVCFATNSVGTGQSSQTNLVVTGNLPVVTILQNAYSVVTGQSVTLECTVSATPTHTNVFWQRIDNGVASTITIDNVKYSGATVNSPSLIINNAAANDQTLYTCSATNSVGTGTSGQTTLSVTGSLPNVTVVQSAYSVVMRQNVTLECLVTADPLHTEVFWWRIDNGDTTNLTIDGVKYMGSTVDTPSLTITDVDAVDQGVYTCSATNIVGTGTSSETSLSVTGSLPEVIVALSAYSVVTGQNVTLECSVTADPSHTEVFWQRIDNGDTTNLTIDGVKYMGSTVDTPSLTITDADAVDQGIYTCSATNILGMGTSSETSLSVTGNVPVVTILQSSYSVLTGSTATLECTVTANPAHTSVFWQRVVNGVTNSILIDGTNYAGSTTDSPSLIIFNANTNDQGVYICFATNIVGTGQSAQTVLSVTGNLPVVTIPQPTYTVTTGQSITIVCSVTSTPAHTSVFWQRIDSGVATTINIDGTKYSGATVNIPSLTISNAAASDQATYTCSATNAVGTGTSGQTVLSVTGAVPAVTVLQPTYSVVTGQTVTLECTVAATPLHTQVYWQRIVNGQAQAITIDGNKYSGSTVSSPSLVIFNAANSDEGPYICFATNIVGTGQSTQTVLSVTGNVPVVTIAQASYSVVTGQSVTLGCTVSADPVHTNVFWTKTVNGQSSVIDLLQTSQYAGGTVNSPSLTILSADASDQAIYTCSATNIVGTGTSSQTTLTVTGAVPVVTILQPSYSVTVGQTVTLQCSVSATPTHTQVYWQRIVNGQAQAITVNGNKYSGSTVNSPSLVIFNAANSDEGAYICFATNIVGTGQSAQTVLAVSGNIPVVTIAQPSYSVITGQSVTLGCTVSANPAHTNVFWQRVVNGVLSTITIDGNKYAGGTVNSPSLIIFNAAASDETTYTCSATNIVGTGTSTQTTLTVTGAPPTVTIAQPSYTVTTGQTVTLVCSVSADPAHTTVFWQRVVNGQTQSVTVDGANYGGSTVSSPSLIVYNADNNDEGIYICFATNSVGTGQSSQTSLVVTGSIPVVVVPQTQVSVVTGTDLTIQCTVTADPAHNIVFWERTIGGVTTQLTIDNVNYGGSAVNTPSLIIYSANSADTGIYVCKAANTVGTGQSAQVQVTVTGNVPSVVIAQPTYSVLTGNSVTLVCSVTATPSHTSVQWLRVVNGVNQPITIGSSGKYVGSTVSVPSLTINGAQSSDQGQYVCTATNIVGTGQSSVTTLSVTGNLPVVTVAQPGYSVTTGGTVTLVCTVNANPAATTVSWRRLVGGVSTSITIDNSKYSGATVANPSLTVTNAQESEEGFYICQATNVVGTGESSTTYLTVTGTAPVVTISQSSYSVLTGSSVTIDCTVAAVPAHTDVTWQKIINSVPSTITIDGVEFSGGTVNNPSLTVINAEQGDEGFYVCTATNSIGTGTSNQAYLSVTGAPPTVTVAQTSYSIITGASVTLQCTAFGNPAVTSVSWTKSTNNGPFTAITITGSKYAGSSVNNPSLTILNADSSDIGVYVCSASNSIGTGSSSQVSLTVTGNPPTVTVSQTQYSVITGSSVTIQCSVTAVPAANSVFWERTANGVTTRLTINQGQYGGSTTNSPSLVIFSASGNDNGVYVCKATNAVGTGESQGVTISVTGDLPLVEIQEPSYSVTTGTTATLVCTITANPQVSSVLWRKTVGGVTTTIGIDGSKYSGGSVISPTLVIQNANSNDVGFYVCQATNAVGTSSSAQTYLEVTGALPIVQVLQPFYTVTKGQSVTLECTVSGTPAATSVAWRRTSGGVTTTVAIDNNLYQGSTIGSPSLVITVADSVDAGSYVCTATNDVGTGQSTTTTLQVTGDIPTVTIPEPSYTVVTGFAVTITCTVSASPPITSVSWSRRTNINDVSTSITIDGSTYNGGSTGVPSLTINSATATDQAYYICSATNSIGTGQSGQTYLTVTGAVPSVTIPSNAYSVITGNSIQIPCTVVASPPASSITWTKTVTPSSGNSVTTTVNIDGSKYQGSSVGIPSLTINNANNNDQAFYVCSATNSVGSAQSIQTYLTVSGSIPTVTLGQDQYTTILGDSITIDCTVSATPQADSISWERVIGGTTTTLTIDGTKFVGSAVNNPSLTINSASTDDQGYYVCIAINSVGIGRSLQGYLTVTGNVPSVVISRPSYTVVVGDTAVIDCDYSSTPSATSIYWNKIVNTETTRLVISNNNRYSGGTLANPSLTISNTNTDDQAFYRCIVGNDVGEGQSSQAYLYVTGNIPSVTVPQTSYTVSLEDTVTLSCTVTASPSATSVSWEYTDTNGVTSDILLTNSRFTGGTVASPSLVISSANLADQGSYRCKATNQVGTGMSSQVYLYVTGTLPSVRVTVSAYTVDVGATATLACIVEASPPATSVFWTKIVNGVASTITTTTNKYDGSTVGTPSLIISNLDVSDEGSYRCNAVNTVGTGQSGLTSLIVAYAPRNTVVNPSAVTRRETESVTSECSTDANPAASYQWVKDNTNQVVSNEKVLQITNIDRGHDGTYTCTATNSQGSDSAKLNVDVQYRPISTVTQEEALVTLSLNAQKTLECNTVANPAVQTYRWLKDGNAISTADSLVYTVTITDNNDYGIYTCYATNSIGQSSAIAFTVQSGDIVTPTPTADEGLTVGLIIAIVISAVVLLLIIIIIVCCCVTHGVCRTAEAVETKRIIYEKPSLRIRDPSPIIMPRQEIIALQEDGFYSNPPSQYRYLPALDYTFYESEGSKRERDRRSFTSVN